MREIDNLKYLSDVYKELFKLVIKYRPSLQTYLTRVWEKIRKMDIDLDECAKECYENFIEGMKAVEEMHEKLENLYTKKLIDDREYFIYLFSLYKLAYTHGNAWYILMDGVVFEGILEEEMEQFLTYATSKMGISVLEFMETIEPLTTPYTHKDPKSREKAKKKFEAYLKKLRECNDVETTDKVMRFLDIYRKLKLWQKKFNLAYDEHLHKPLQKLWSSLTNILKSFNITVPDKYLMPWTFIPYIEDAVLPDILARGDSK